LLRGGGAGGVGRGGGGRRYFWTAVGFVPALGAFQWSDDLKGVTVWRSPLGRVAGAAVPRGAGAGVGTRAAVLREVLPGEAVRGVLGVQVWSGAAVGGGVRPGGHPGTGYGLALDARNRSVWEREVKEVAKAECGFCRFMRAGACAGQFDAWERCVEAHRKSEDFVEKCLAVTRALKECMEAHPDYYEPVLDEPSAEEDAA